MAISSNLGFIVGPGIAGISGSTIYQEIVPIFVALFLSLITLIVIALRLKESKHQLEMIKQISEKENIGKVFAQGCRECYSINNPKKT